MIRLYLVLSFNHDPSKKKVLIMIFLANILQMIFYFL